MSKSKYKHVSHLVDKRYRRIREYWQAHLLLSNGRQWNKQCKTEREAAIAADIKLIELGRKPVNILTKKL